MEIQMAKKIAVAQVCSEGFVIIDNKLHNVDFGNGIMSVVCYVTDADSAVRYSMHLTEAVIFNSYDEAFEHVGFDTEAVVRVVIEEPVSRYDHKHIIMYDRKYETTCRGQRCIVK